MQHTEKGRCSSSEANERKPIRSGIEAIKDAVPVERYAADVAQGLKQVSKTQMRGCCPVHEGDNPTAFVVLLDANRWYCHRCHLGGDVLDLCELVEKHAETWTAMLSLAQRYGIELPTRSERWRCWQDEKARCAARSKSSSPEPTNGV